MLIGLPGAGKSTLAPLIAAELGCNWCDIDRRIEQRHAMSVTEVFARHGEARFRQDEQGEMQRALAEDPQVIATGGGWAAQPGNLDAVGPRGLVIYLSLTPAEAAARLAGTSGRPLLDAGDRSAPLAELLRAREFWYRRADIEIAVGATSPETATVGVVTVARQYGGWPVVGEGPGPPT